MPACPCWIWHLRHSAFLHIGTRFVKIHCKLYEYIFGKIYGKLTKKRNRDSIHCTENVFGRPLKGREHRDTERQILFFRQIRHIAPMEDGGIEKKKKAKQRARTVARDICQARAPQKSGTVPRKSASESRGPRVPQRDAGPAVTTSVMIGNRLQIGGK